MRTLEEHLRTLGRCMRSFCVPCDFLSVRKFRNAFMPFFANPLVDKLSVFHILVRLRRPSQILESRLKKAAAAPFPLFCSRPSDFLSIAHKFRQVAWRCLLPKSFRMLENFQGRNTLSKLSRHPKLLFAL